jgi:hypothetical protein
MITSFGELSELFSNTSATGVVTPFTVRVTLREPCSAASTAPEPSMASPLELLLGIRKMVGAAPPGT